LKYQIAKTASGANTLLSDLQLCNVELHLSAGSPADRHGFTNYKTHPSAINMPTGVSF
jgi:hypothetical protein